jgi:dynein heavy chain
MQKSKISEVIQRESKGPMEYIKVYDKYVSLINKTAEEEVEAFIKEGHSFNEFEREIKRYQRLVKDITYNLHKVVRVGMFELHCDELIRAMSKRAEALLNKLLDYIISDNFEKNKQ